MSVNEIHSYLQYNVVIIVCMSKTLFYFITQNYLCNCISVNNCIQFIKNNVCTMPIKK